MWCQSRGATSRVCVCGVFVVGILAACTPQALSTSPNSAASCNSSSATPAIATTGGSRLDQLYSDARAERQFMWGHLLQADRVQPIKDAFERQFPGITMTPVSVDGTTQAASHRGESGPPRLRG